MELQEIIETIDTQLKPVSTILYGSRARTDFLETSDYEIALLFKRENLKTWSDIRDLVNQEGVNIYPFVYEDFLKGKIDAPFQKRIFQRELIVAGKTLSGEKVIENMNPPQIRIIDLIGDLRFNSGYALASVIPFRNIDFETASLLFYKSCLFATRDLVMLEQHKFPTTYDDILRLSEKSNLGIHGELVRKAYDTRMRKSEVEQSDLILNVSYINDHIEPKLLDQYKRDYRKKNLKNLLKKNRIYWAKNRQRQKYLSWKRNIKLKSLKHNFSFNEWLCSNPCYFFRRFTF